MKIRRDQLERIAAALERIAPPAPKPVNWSQGAGFMWDGVSAEPIPALDAPALDQLRGIADQKAAICANLDRFASGAAAHDMLLWGARGMGKSALIRAAVAGVQAEHPGNLALIQLAPDALHSIPVLLAALAREARTFVIFIDDLGFDAGDAQGNLMLRSLLDGGAVTRPANIRLAVTSNRRAIARRDESESDALHERDERDNALALADRFGLTLGFHPCDQATYLEIVRAYTDPLGLEADEEQALAWAINRGSRSGRTAYQFACELAGRAGLPL